MSETPDISDFSKAPNMPDETKDAFKKFMGKADPMEVNDTSKPRPSEESEEKLQELIDSVESSPELTYEQRLAQHKVTREEALQIVDDIMTKGLYTRDYKITGKTDVTFRSRDLGDQERAQQALEEQVPQFSGTVSIILAKHNLAASLAKFGDKEFPDTDDGFKKAYAFVGKLPHMLFNVLVSKLSQFDELVLTVMDEGAIENF